MPRKYNKMEGIQKYDPERKVSYYSLYVVVAGDGTLKQPRSSVIAYRSLTRACAAADGEGDAVVEVEVNLGRAPVFINKKTV